MQRQGRFMIITKRSDYALRVCRVLKDGKTHNVRDICEQEDIPKAFAYKIIRELEQSGIVKSERGKEGGYYLNRKLEDLTVYDIVSVTEEESEQKRECSWICHSERRGIQERHLRGGTAAPETNAP